MADTPETKKTNDAQDAIRAAARNAAQEATGATQRGAASVEESGRAGGEALRQSADAAASVGRRSGEAGEQAMRHFGSATGETVRRGTQAIADGQHRLAHDMAEQFEETARKIAGALQDTASNMHALMSVPGTAGGGWQDLQHGFGSLVEGVISTNLRATAELCRMASPAAIVELQQRFMREYLDTLMEGSVAFARASREAAEQTLRPLQERLERRQAQSNGNGQHHTGRVRDVMAREVRVANPDDTVQQVARLMREQETGVLPVGEGDRLIGMVTDRDLAVRLVAEGRDAARTKVREVMTPEVRYVFEDEDLDHVADDMAEQQVRRLPVVNRDKRLVGVVSLGDLAQNGKARFAGRALGGIAREGGQHAA